jgi:acetyl esterase
MNRKDVSMTKQSRPVILEQKTQQFIDALAAQGGEPIYQLSISDARAVLDTAQSQPVETLAARIEDLTIPGGPTGNISVRTIRPESASGTLPVVMYFHGGGWILGNKNTHDRLVREIANGANAAVVFVNYDPSPEAKYPTPTEQAYAATKYLAEHGEELEVDGSRLAVAGDSVGGNMAAVVALLAKERGGPELTHQVLFYPVTDASLKTPSYRQFADGPWLTKAAMEWFWNAYAPDKGVRRKPTVSPLSASLEQLEGLPPATVLTDENDVLRDEGEMYAQKLMQAGVEVTAVRYLGTIHDFVMLNAIATTPAARSAIGLANNKLRSALAVGGTAARKAA